jgi:hypothetical protein
MNTLFNYKTFVFINATVLNSNLMFELNIVSLEYHTEKLVKRIPLLYTGSIVKAEDEKISNIDRIVIEMQQNGKL